MSRTVPLQDLFGKAEAVEVRVSPGGKYVSWLGRGLSGQGQGVLDLWIAPTPPRDR